ncbi:GMC oxidoreductase [Bradyrhizobium sp. CCBAU 53421]|uniref:GMC oxidoreductase n=1 Tax=Bradyrhizobium sp. CCBAU 53421 TaxID=1325120 RepID=UPI001AED5DD7
MVDARLRVRGVDGLRVIDASIMPNITSGNTNAPTQALAPHATAMLVEDLKPTWGVVVPAGRDGGCTLRDTLAGARAGGDIRDAFCDLRGKVPARHARRGTIDRLIDRLAEVAGDISMRRCGEHGSISSPAPCSQIAFRALPSLAICR